MPRSNSHTKTEYTYKRNKLLPAYSRFSHHLKHTSLNSLNSYSPIFYIHLSTCLPVPPLLQLPTPSTPSPQTSPVVSSPLLLQRITSLPAASSTVCLRRRLHHRSALPLAAMAGEFPIWSKSFGWALSKGLGETGYLRPSWVFFALRFALSARSSLRWHSPFFLFSELLALWSSFRKGLLWTFPWTMGTWIWISEHGGVGSRFLGFCVYTGINHLPYRFGSIWSWWFSLGI